MELKVTEQNIKKASVNISDGKMYKQTLYDVINAYKEFDYYKDDLELLSSEKKGYGAKLNGFINEGIITEEELEDLKLLGLTESLIVQNINDYKILLNIVKWDIVSILKMEGLITVNNGNLIKIKGNLRQIVDLDNRILNKNQKKIIENFLE